MINFIRRGFKCTGWITQLREQIGELRWKIKELEDIIVKLKYNESVYHDAIETSQWEFSEQKIEHEKLLSKIAHELCEEQQRTYLLAVENDSLRKELNESLVDIVIKGDRLIIKGNYRAK